MKDNIIHLHHGWDDPKQVKRDPLHLISIGIAVCGAQRLPRGTFVNDPKIVSCKACLTKMQEQPAPPPPKPAPPPSPTMVKADKALPIGTIIALVKHNPRKPGSGKYERMSLLLKYNGQSVAAFVKAGGNLETLKNAVKEKIVSVQ